MQNQIQKRGKLKVVEPLVYGDIKETYLAVIKENIGLITNLREKGDSLFTSFDPTNTEPFYKSRACHIQFMSILGLTTEHLVKLILLKRGFLVNKIKYIKQKNNKTKSISYEPNLIEFNLAVKLFNESNDERYYSNIGGYKFEMSNFPNYDELYFGKSEINPQNCLELIVSVRNNYMHHAGPRGEQNGIIWYMFNFILWISKKEYPEYFDSIKYIGNSEIQKLFIK